MVVPDPPQHNIQSKPKIQTPDFVSTDRLSTDSRFVDRLAGNGVVGMCTWKGNCQRSCPCKKQIKVVLQAATTENSARIIIDDENIIFFLENTFKNFNSKNI